MICQIVVKGITWWTIVQWVLVLMSIGAAVSRKLLHCDNLSSLQPRGSVTWNRSVSNTQTKCRWSLSVTPASATCRCWTRQSFWCQTTSQWESLSRSSGGLVSPWPLVGLCCAWLCVSSVCASLVSHHWAHWTLAFSCWCVFGWCLLVVWSHT